MVDLGRHVFKILNTGKITPDKLFANAYIGEVYKSEHAQSASKLLRLILDSKYKDTDLHKVMETRCQHLTMTQCNELLKLLQRLKYFFYETDGAWKLDPVDFN